MIRICIYTKRAERKQDLRAAFGVCRSIARIRSVLRLHIGKLCNSSFNGRTSLCITRNGRYRNCRNIGVGIAAAQRPATAVYLCIKNKIYKSILVVGFRIFIIAAQGDERVNNTRQALLLNVVDILERLGQVKAGNIPCIISEARKRDNKSGILVWFSLIKLWTSNAEYQLFNQRYIGPHVFGVCTEISASCKRKHLPFTADRPELRLSG